MLSHITKRFGQTLAVDDVTLEIAPGEILALAGENGAGKTTLMRIAASEIRPDSGSVDASGGVGFVHQHFLLVNDFTIAENLALAGVSGDPGIALPDLSRRVADLSVGERAKVELAKAIARKPEVLILDEPTSVLTPTETDELFAIMRDLAGRGTAIVFISHKIPEVMRVATRFVVMRQGRIVANAKRMTAEDLARAMVDVSGAPPAPSTQRRQDWPFGFAQGRLRSTLHIENLALDAGEIVAIIGVAGNGQSELASRLRDRFRTNAGFIPEDRTRDGIIAEMSIEENLAVAGTRESAASLIERFDIRARGPEQRAGTLSGGNQQKLILARELARNPEVIVAAEPTRGLDIEATRFVHQELRNAAAGGTAILLITSDLDEAFALASAIHVMYRGRLSARLSPNEATRQAAHLMAGIA